MQLLIVKLLLFFLFHPFASASVTRAGMPREGIGNPDTQHQHPRAAQDPGPGLPGLTLPSSIPGPADNGQLGCTYCGSSHGSPALLDCTTHSVKAWCQAACVHTEECTIV